jgi:hypothetical protein
MNNYLIVSFYTKNTPYEQEILNLKDSLDKFKLNYIIEGVEPRGSWMKNTNYKPTFIYEMWKKHKRPIVWLDSDSIIRGNPSLFETITEDFAVHVVNDGKINDFFAAVLFFNQTPAAEHYLKLWIDKASTNFNYHDQWHLQSLWGDVTKQCGLTTRWLPQHYAKIFDWRGSVESNEPIVIEQFQASRRFKPLVNVETK